MKIENMCHIIFTDEEVKQALIHYLEAKLNKLPNDRGKYKRLRKIIHHARQDKFLDIDHDGNGGFVLMLNGVISKEKL